jgi:hypothetical protein
MIHADLPLMQALAAHIGPQIGLPDKGIGYPIDTALAQYAITRHRVGSLLYAAAKHGTNVDEDAAAALLSCYQKNTLDTLAQKAVLHRLEKLFQENGIEFSVLKGMGLAEQIYNEPELRQANDIDILIPVQAVDAAIRLLTITGFGYRPHTINKNVRVTQKRQRSDMNLFKDLMFLDPQFSKIIELHQRLFMVEPRGFTRDFNSSIGFQKIPTIANAHYCLYLILHGVVSIWNRLKWVADLSLLVRHMPFEQREELLDFAKRYGCQQAVCASLWFADEIFAGTLDYGWRAILNEGSGSEEALKLSELFRKSLLTTSPDRPEMSAAKTSKFFDIHAHMFGHKISMYHIIMARIRSSIAIRT